MSEGKKTPLYEIHRTYGGRMVEFADWLLPVQYSGIKEEHEAVRTRAGLFDVSHMGEIAVQGSEALPFLQKLLTNDAARLMDHQVQYTIMCYPDGGTVDDLLLYKYGVDDYLLVVNAANSAKDWAWLLDNSQSFQVCLTNRSEQIGQLALQGPRSQEILTLLTDAPLASTTYYRFMPEIELAGKKVMISRTGYTGEDGFELYCATDDVVHVWEQIMAAGVPLGLVPAGLGCRDTLRFEACLPLYGHELSESITPLEAGLDRFVKLDKGSFNGSQALAAQKAQGVQRKLVGLEMVGRGIARAGYPVLLAGKPIGDITSGSYTPTLDKNLGLALIDAEYANVGQPVTVEIRGQQVLAQIVEKPFYKRKGT